MRDVHESLIMSDEQAWVNKASRTITPCIMYLLQSAKCCPDGRKHRLIYRYLKCGYKIDKSLFWIFPAMIWPLCHLTFMTLCHKLHIWTCSLFLNWPALPASPTIINMLKQTIIITTGASKLYSGSALFATCLIYGCNEETCVLHDII